MGWTLNVVGKQNSFFQLSPGSSAVLDCPSGRYRKQNLLHQLCCNRPGPLSTSYPWTGPAGLWEQLFKNWLEFDSLFPTSPLPDPFPLGCKPVGRDCLVLTDWRKPAWEHFCWRRRYRFCKQIIVIINYASWEKRERNGKFEVTCFKEKITLLKLQNIVVWKECISHTRNVSSWKEDIRRARSYLHNKLCHYFSFESILSLHNVFLWYA